MESVDDRGVVHAGDVFAGDYRVIEPLAEGGMGAVYIAEQLSTGKRRALKTMHPALVADAKLRERFEQEARIGSRIESEHIVEVVAAGVDESTGMPWLAMELLRGEDLEHFIEKHGAIPSRELALIFEPLCHAIGAAHRAGVVHRDLKPENIFVAESQRAREARTVKVLDFGIAKIVEDSRLRTGVVGTPMWMAPEQTQSSPIDARADVWALGLIAFYALTGRVYWRAADRPDATIGSILHAITSEPLVPPSLRALDWNGADRLPTSFDAWFARCVNRDIESRFANADAAWQSLAPLLSRRSNLELARTQLGPWASAQASVHVSIPPPRMETPSTRGLVTTLAGLVALSLATAGFFVYRAHRKGSLAGSDVSIRVRDGKFLTAIAGGGIVASNGLRSNATDVGPSERFTLVPRSPLARHSFAIRTDHGTYLTATNAGGSAGSVGDAVRTDAVVAGPTEVFHLVGAGDEPSDPECQTARSKYDVPCAVVALRTSDGTHYLSAIDALRAEEHVAGAPIHTDALRVSAWETFTIEDRTAR